MPEFNSLLLTEEPNTQNSCMRHGLTPSSYNVLPSPTAQVSDTNFIVEITEIDLGSYKRNTIPARNAEVHSKIISIHRIILTHTYIHTHVYKPEHHAHFDHLVSMCVVCVVCVCVCGVCV